MARDRIRILREIIGNLRLDAAPPSMSGLARFTLRDEQNFEVAHRDVPTRQAPETAAGELAALRDRLETARSSLTESLDLRHDPGIADRPPIAPTDSRELDMLRVGGHLLPPILIGGLMTAFSPIVSRLDAAPLAGFWTTLLPLAIILGIQRFDFDATCRALHEDISEDRTLQVPVLNASRSAVKAVARSFLGATVLTLAGVGLCTLAVLHRIAFGYVDSPWLSGTTIACTLLWPCYYAEYEIAKILLGDTPRTRTRRTPTGAAWTEDLHTRATLVVAQSVEKIDAPIEPIPAIALDNAFGQPVLYLTPTDGISLWTLLDETSRVLTEVSHDRNAAARMREFDRALAELPTALPRPRIP